jgi:hypothetical protein
MIYNPRDPDFSFINCTESILYLRIAYNIVTYNDLWEFLYNYKPESQTKESFQYEFLKDKIKNSVVSHTEETLNWTMDVILYIAKNGFFKYKETYISEYTRLTKKTKHQIIKEKLEKYLEKEIKTEIDNHIISKDYLETQRAISLEQERNHIPEVSVLELSYKL